MIDSQITKQKKLRPFTSILQLVESYIVAESVEDIRKKDFEIKLKNKETQIPSIEYLFEDMLIKAKEDKKAAIQLLTDMRIKGNSIVSGKAPDAIAKMELKNIEIIQNANMLESHLNDLNWAYKETCNICQYKMEYIASFYLAIVDMFEFKFHDSPSVNANSSFESHIVESYGGSSYNQLKNITLLYHTIHVFKKAVEVVSQGERALLMENALLSALLHDFGKSPEIIKKVNVENKNKLHPEISSAYITNILQRQCKDYLKQIGYTSKILSGSNDPVYDNLMTISEVVKNHHINKDDRKMTPLIEFVKFVDHESRNFEIRMLDNIEADKEKFLNKRISELVKS